MQESISVIDIYQILKKRKITIILFTLLSLIIGSIITFFIITPQYEANTQILVNQTQESNEEISSTDLQSSQELVNTYSVIMTSPVILEEVIQNSNFTGNVDELSSKISVEAEEGSQVVTVFVEDDNPELALDIADELGVTFAQSMPNIMEVDNVSILSEAKMLGNGEPISPQPILNLAISIIIGLIIGIVIAFLLEFLDRSIKTETDIENTLNLPLLGSVPNIKESEISHTKTKDNNRS